MLGQRGRHDASVHHQRIGAPYVAPRPDGAGVIGRQLIEQFGFNPARKAH
jgi:hypothetical protein